MNNNPLHVVILAAGKGSRMRSDLPKVLHKIAGKPLLAHVINSALALSPESIQVVVGHGRDKVIDELEIHPARDKINFVTQEQQLGTGHAVAMALPHIPEQTHVLMLTADVPLIKSNTLTRMVESLQSHTLTVLTAIVDNPFGLGRITRDSTQAVNGIVEEKDATSDQRQIKEINSGIICARRDELSTWLEKLDNSNNQQEYYLTDVVKFAYDAGDPITTLQPSHNREVSGINDRIQLAAAERAYQRDYAENVMQQGTTLLDPSRVDFRGDIKIGEDSIIDVNVVFEGDCIIGKNVTIAANCVISNSRIGDNVRIHANTVIEQADIAAEAQIGPFARLRPGTKLAENVKIGNFVETKNASLNRGAKVNHLSYVGDASVGSNTNIGAGVITCNYDGANKHKTNIGSNVFVGSDCQLVAPITISDGATIGAGTTVTTDVANDVLVVGRGKQREIRNWKRPTKNK